MASLLQRPINQQIAQRIIKYIDIKHVIFSHHYLIHLCRNEQSDLQHITDLYNNLIEDAFSFILDVDHNHVPMEQRVLTQISKSLDKENHFGQLLHFLKKCISIEITKQLDKCNYSCLFDSTDANLQLRSNHRSKLLQIIGFTTRFFGYPIFYPIKIEKIPLLEYLFFAAHPLLMKPEPQTNKLSSSAFFQEAEKKRAAEDLPQNRTLTLKEFCHELIFKLRCCNVNIYHHFDHVTRSTRCRIKDIYFRIFEKLFSRLNCDPLLCQNDFIQQCVTTISALITDYLNQNKPITQTYHHYSFISESFSVSFHRNLSSCLTQIHEQFLKQANDKADPSSKAATPTTSGLR